jgi:hypothetical protein
MNQAGSKKQVESSVASRLARYTAAAGLGSFAFGHTVQATIYAVDAPDFLTKSLVGNPYYPAPIEDAYYPGNFPFRSIGWATEGFGYQYGGTYTPTTAWGIDLDFNGTGDINFFRGRNYGGYLIANSTKVGYYNGFVNGSGQVTILSNDTENPDGDGSPSPSASKRLLQGFAAGQVIGDGNDVSTGTLGGVMRDAYSVGDWDGVPDNYGNFYDTGNPGDPSYVGFEITGLANGGSGFGWIEVVVREGTLPGYVNPSHPELQILSWAFTDDGSSIVAGDTGVLPGDLDGDGFVGINDLNIVLGNWNQTVTAGDKLVGDPSGDGFVGIDDLNEVLGAWNTGTPPVSETIPEPTMLMMLAVGAGSAALRRKSRSA